VLGEIVVLIRFADSFVEIVQMKNYVMQMENVQQFAFLIALENNAEKTDVLELVEIV
jgi:hypothetical protein